jgi:hypothetical protein
VKASKSLIEPVIDEFSGEQLTDQSPKFLGMDYFRVIYISTAILVGLMLLVYFTIDDEKV